MKKQLLSLLVVFTMTSQAQHSRAGGIDESQATVTAKIKNTPTASRLINKSPVMYVQGGVEVRKDESVNLSANNKSMSPEYFNDVIIENSTFDQRNVKITAAFNGWLYSAFSTSNTINGNGGINIRRSKNNGVSWTTFSTFSFANMRFPALDIVVAGTDTNNLTLFVTGVNQNTSTGVNILWFDKYNATTGAMLGQFGANINYGTTKRVNDVAIASDYKFPAVGATPYSIGVLYSLWSSAVDSIIFVASVNGGTSMTVRQPVTSTGYYSRKVDLAYGRSLNGSNGRYFGVWEQLAGNFDRNGNIYTSRSASTVGGTWIAPKNLDSIPSGMARVCRNPVIAVQHNNINNDSSATTALVLVERDFTGTGSDYDILGMYNKTAHYTNRWYRLDVMNTSEKDNQPHIAYDPANNNFLTVYHDSSNHRLPYKVNGMNLTTPNTWGAVTNQYNDLTTNIINPWPRVDINPAVVKTVHVWNSEGTAGKGIALFDAENLYTSVKEVSETTISSSVYPNPASTFINLSFELKNVQDVTMNIYDALGNVVKHEIYYGVSNKDEIKTINIAHLPDGVYILKLSSENVVFSKKIVKASN